MPPYLRLVLASACWKASKMIRCFSGGIPMPVSETSNDTTRAASRSIACDGVQPSAASVTEQAHAAVGGELERIRQQVLEDLLQAFGIGHDAGAKTRVDLHVERQTTVFGVVLERAGPPYPGDS